MNTSSDNEQESQEVLLTSNNIKKEFDLNEKVSNIYKIEKSVSILWQDFIEDSILKNEMSKYDHMQSIRMNDDPLAFWNRNSLNLPDLTRLARKYLSIPGSSASSERVFSCSGLIASDLRNRLSMKNLEMLVFLRHNRKNFEL